ncbi:MAG TPA: DUF3566 domain-containing protein [Candidatus Angelobacter sp.]|jgi:hypothetical protein|nr:DUF3566 domain-containing protein [Candidatus Angelobacter sp.]
MRKIKSVNVISVALTAAVVYGCLSLVVVPFILLFISMGVFSAMNANNPFGQAGQIGAAAGVIMMVIIPICYAAAGFIFGALGAFVYNLAAKWTGGIEVELEPQTAA